METNQLICKANQLAGFHVIRAFTRMFFRKDNSNNQVKHFTLIIPLPRKNA